MAATYGRVTKRTLGDGLEQSRLSNICKTNLQVLLAKFAIEKGRESYDTTLQVVPRSTQHDLLLLDSLLWRHLFLFRVRS